jgi:hypothetical protein
VPVIDPGYGNARKRKPAQRRGAIGRGADTTTARPARTPARKPVYGPPAPPPKRTGVFAPGAPKPATRPIRVAQRQAQVKVDRARRALPAPTLAAPPIIHVGAGRASGAPMPRAQVEAFLRSEGRVTDHARKQIVTSIRANLGNTRGRERQEMTQRLIREIATDPRLAPTRRAIKHYTALEAKTATPQTRATVKAGPKPRKARVGVGPLAATVNLTAASRAITVAAEKAAPGLTRTTAEAKFGKNALSDLAHLPLMAPQTAYQIAAAAKEAAGGDTKRAKALAKSFTEGVIGHAARGDWNGLADYFVQHPVFAILEISGGKGVVGRGTGAVMRSGAIGKGAQRAASTARRDLNLSGEGARVADRQHYSPDVITKAVQVALERKRNGKSRAQDHRLRRRADFESDMAAASSRAVRADEARKAVAAKPKGPLAEVVGLVVQGVVRPKTIEADLRKELGRLDHAHATAEFSTGAQKRQNRATADAIRKVLDSPAAMRRIGEVAQSGRTNVRAINAHETRATDLGAITPERADRAKLFPAAQAHLGAEYSDAPFRAAREREVAAARRLRSATAERQNARVTYARRASRAQRRLAETKRAYLRGDETYSLLRPPTARRRRARRSCETRYAKRKGPAAGRGQSRGRYVQPHGWRSADHARRGSGRSAVRRVSTRRSRPGPA